MVRTTLGAEVDTTVTVSGSESVEFLKLNQSSTISGGGFEDVFVRPPAGFLYEVISLRLKAFGIAGQGSESHDMKVVSETQSLEVLNGESDGASDVQYLRSYWKSANNLAEPQAPGDQTAAIRGLRIDPLNGLRLRYNNNTTADQTNGRTYQVWVRKIRVSD